MRGREWGVRESGDQRERWDERLATEMRNMHGMQVAGSRKKKAGQVPACNLTCKSHTHTLGRPLISLTIFSLSPHVVPPHLFHSGGWSLSLLSNVCVK